MRSGWAGLCIALGLLSTACGVDGTVGAPSEAHAGTSDPGDHTSSTPKRAFSKDQHAHDDVAAATLARGIEAISAELIDVRAGRPSPACRSGTAIIGGTHTREWLDVDRQVIVHLPAHTTAGPPPVVFSLHGSAASGASHDAWLNFSEPAADRGYVVLVPEGMPPTEEAPLQVWELFPGIYPDDPGYLASLVDWIGESACVDLDRVFVAGFSNGAALSNVVACHTEGRFRAIGAVAAQRFPLLCPSGPVSVLGIHGTDDWVVPYEGGPLLRRPTIVMPPVEETFDDWAEVAGCDPEPVIEPVTPDVRLHRWVRCVAGAEVMLYEVVGGGHAWPSPEDPFAPATIDATSLLLDFFDLH